jgi:hypothetical protein
MIREGRNPFSEEGVQTEGMGRDSFPRKRIMTSPTKQAAAQAAEITSA